MIVTSHSTQFDKTLAKANIPLQIVHMMNQQRIVAEHVKNARLDMELQEARYVLDVACGPGGWVLDTAFAHPEATIIGIDHNPEMVEYAKAQAWTRKLKNAVFIEGDMHRMEVLPDDGFDLVHCRFLAQQVSWREWRNLLRELMRVCRPGGKLCWVEGGKAQTNSKAYEKWYNMIRQILQMEDKISDVTPMMASLLREAGCVDVHQVLYPIDYSVETPPYYGMYRDVAVVFTCASTLIIASGVAGQEKLDDLLRQMIVEMLLNDFRAIWPVLVLWGMKYDGAQPSVPSMVKKDCALLQTL